MKKIFFLLFVSIIFSCNSTFEVKDATHINALPNIYPDYTFVTIPSTIAPLNFQADDSLVDAINVVFKGKNSKLEYSANVSIDIDIDKWHNFLSQNVDDSIKVTVSFLKDSKWLTYNDFSIFISKDSIDFGVNYRLISPGYGIFSDMGLFERNLSNFDETTIYPGSKLERGCINCHTSNRCNSNFSSTHFRGENGATIVRRDDDYKAFNLKANSNDLPCVYTYWHPSGKHIAYSQNATNQFYHTQNPKKITVYDNKSDIVVLDIDKNLLISSPLLKTDFLETSPAFSPDGKTMYFLTSQPCKFPDEYQKAEFVLCSIAFDENSNSFGQTVDTLIDMREDGKSIAWTHPSFDGKFLLFTVSDYGQFPIWNNDADIWLYDIGKKEKYPLTNINSNRSDSYHNWSSNSRWIVFTSRRDDGYYSLLYLAHIDQNGVASKAFMLPQRNPRYYLDNQLKSYNTPDFAQKPTNYNSNKVESILFNKKINSVTAK